MIYNEEFETLPHEALEALQLKRIRQVVHRVYHTVGFYKKAFDKAGVSPESLKTFDDLKRFPMTTKQDLRDNYPFGLFAAPMSNVVRLHASSGTTGASTVVGYTRQDIETWAELMGRCFVAAGLTKTTSFTTHTATACSQGAWALITGRKKSAQAWSRCPAATRSVRL
jgi:phenylacetate-CoA ligase